MEDLPSAVSVSARVVDPLLFCVLNWPETAPVGIFLQLNVSQHMELGVMDGVSQFYWVFSSLPDRPPSIYSNSIKTAAAVPVAVLDASGNFPPF